MHAHPLVNRAARPCDRCRRPVVWVILDTGKRMPVDPDPDPGGTVAVRVDQLQAIRGRVIDRERSQLEGTERLHMTHFATCTPRAVPLPPPVGGGVVIPITRPRRRGGRR